MTNGDVPGGPAARAGGISRAAPRGSKEPVSPPPRGVRAREHSGRARPGRAGAACGRAERALAGADAPTRKRGYDKRPRRAFGKPMNMIEGNRDLISVPGKPAERGGRGCRARKVSRSEATGHSRDRTRLGCSPGPDAAVARLLRSVRESRSERDHGQGLRALASLGWGTQRRP